MAVIDISSKFLHLATSSKSFSHSIRNFVNCFSQLPDVVASLPFKLNNLFIVMASFLRNLRLLRKLRIER